MDRPSEQPIRDYLNRLSLAAKSRLEPAERQALLDHTRARIDAGCGGAAHPTAEEVRRTLSGLGDPIALVENERSRIAARKAWDEEAAPAASLSRGGGSPRQLWPPPATPAIAGQPFMPAVVVPPATASPQVSPPRPATTTSSSAGTSSFSVNSPLLSGQPIPVSASVPEPAARPVPPVQQAPANGPVIAGEAAGRAEPVSASNGAWAGPPMSPGEVPPGPGRANGSAGAAKPSSEDPPERSRPGRPASPAAPRGLPPLRGVPAPRKVSGPDESSASGGGPAPQGGAGGGAAGSARRNRSDPLPVPAALRRAPRSRPRRQGASSRAAGGASVPRKPPPEPKPVSKSGEDGPTIEFSVDAAGLDVRPSRAAVAGDAAVRRLRRLGSALLTIARRDRMETVSLLLLGIGGAIYPPVWLIGAVVAVWSRKWDLRDKWLGLALPVLAVVIGAALEVTFGGHFTAYRPYLVEAWVAAGRLSRLVAILGAVYLLWRLHKHRGARTMRPPPWLPQNKPRR